MNRLTEFKEWVINLNESTLDDIVFYYDENAYKKYSNSFLKHPESKKETIAKQIIRELYKL